MSNLSEEEIAGLKESISGHVIAPGDDNYDEVRTIWNAMIDRKPGLIVQCASATDVAPSIAFAREHD